jgi:hypothetical protein
MTKTKLAFALLTVVAGLVGVSQAQAGAGAYQLGSSAFENRCEAHGGDLMATSSGYGCELGALLIDCAFVGAQTYCEWNGAQNQREVSRVLGAAVAESLSEPSQGKKKLKFNPQIIDKIKLP